MNRMIGAVLGFCLVGCAGVAPVTAPGLVLRKVVVYRNGVGYFERGGRVQGDRVQFKVRKDEVGDFLATLAVLERGGSSVRSASFPLQVQNENEKEKEKESPPEPAPMASGGVSVSDKNKLLSVIMSLDGREHDLQVGYIAATPVWKPSYRLVIEKDGASLQAWGIVQNLSGEDWNNVSLSLIAEAPLAFDASLAIPVIPPRPIVTDGGDVIAVVPRSETSLADAPPAPPPAPAAMPSESLSEFAESEMDMAEDEAKDGLQRLSPRDRAKSKKEIRPSKPTTATKMRAPAVRSMGGQDHAMGVAAAPQAAFSRQTKNLSALAAVALQAGATRYELPTPVTIPNKSATMVMLLDRHVPGEAISLFAPDDGVPESKSHPFRVARFTNKTGGLLERGPLAIFSEGAFLGQGMADALPDGATATVPFALERTLAVDVSRENREEGVRLYHIEGGMLTVVRDAVWLTKYHVKNGADRPAKLLVKHQRMSGARLNKPPAGTEDNVGSGSALVPLPLGIRATMDLTIDERQESQRGLDWLSPLADEAVNGYMTDRRAQPVAVAQLKTAWEIRQVLVKATEHQQKLGAEDQELRRATEETRANLKALEKNAAAADLRGRLTKRLAADSARLDVVGKQMIEVKLKVNENQIRFNEAIRAVKVLEPLTAA
ncbi:MAG: DUF4139 domain-containing protein [Deltaproteobacteria bacterium]|nr:DUF4139 domain-containing protein [Deltaproteobacteria bacterium]